MTTLESMSKVRGCGAPSTTPRSALGPGASGEILVVISGMSNIKGPEIKRK